VSFQLIFGYLGFQNIWFFVLCKFYVLCKKTFAHSFMCSDFPLYVLLEFLLIIRESNFEFKYDALIKIFYVILYYVWTMIGVSVNMVVYNNLHGAQNWFTCMILASLCSIQVWWIRIFHFNKCYPYWIYLQNKKWSNPNLINHYCKCKLKNPKQEIYE
jgi:hypothetical protein